MYNFFFLRVLFNTVLFLVSYDCVIHTLIVHTPSLNSKLSVLMFYLCCSVLRSDIAFNVHTIMILQLFLLLIELLLYMAIWLEMFMQITKPKNIQKEDIEKRKRTKLHTGRSKLRLKIENEEIKSWNRKFSSSPVVHLEGEDTTRVKIAVRECVG